MCRCVGVVMVLVLVVLVVMVGVGVLMLVVVMVVLVVLVVGEGERSFSPSCARKKHAGTVECELELLTSGGSSDVATSGTNSLKKEISQDCVLISQLWPPLRTRAAEQSIHPSYTQLSCLKYTPSCPENHVSTILPPTAVGKGAPVTLRSMSQLPKEPSFWGQVSRNA